VRSAYRGFGSTELQTLNADIYSMREQHTEELALFKEQVYQLANETQQQLSAIGDVRAKQHTSQKVHDNSAAETSGTAFDHRHQRPCVAPDERPAPARDKVIDTIFSFVGIGDYYYVAAVCRNWRGRYVTFCQNTPERWTNVLRSTYTSCDNIVATAARLQLALDNG
jgi:hypothetical protein